MKVALVSVSNKEGIEDFCRELVKLGYAIFSTGGTAAALKRAGIAVVDVADYTGFPEIMDGRVKTLHPKVHGGILADRDKAHHRAAMEEHGIQAIDMVVVNLYPFEETVKKPNVTLEEAIENIDIGGPTMVRAAAKNHEHVIVLVDPGDYSWVLGALRERGNLTQEEHRRLAAKAFAHTGRYDSLITAYLEETLGEELPTNLGIFLSPKKSSDFLGTPLFFHKVQGLRYGENPHQKAAFYAEGGEPWGLARARQIQGKELSYNNLLDLHSVLALALEFQDPVAVIAKHNNPCGVAVGESLSQAYGKALGCDPVSAYGGIMAFNREVDGEAAREITKIFVEAIIAPGYTPEALEVFSAKANLRLLELNPWPEKLQGWDLRRVAGGLLVQEPDTLLMGDELRVVTKRGPTEEEWKDLTFAWRVVKHVKSNAIVLAREGQTVGIGAGQMSRVDSVKIAIMKARIPTRDSVLASDAFFPFPDGVEEGARAGVRAVIQPGGSIRDKEVIRAADRLGLAMVFTSMRHFRH